MAGIDNGESRTDDFIEFVTGDELEDGELADGDDELRSQQGHLGFEPAGAVGDFGRVGHAIAAAGFFTGETAADSSHVDVGTEGGFIDTGVVLEPAEKLFARGPGEGTSEDRFLVAGGLANEKDAADDGAAADDGLLHFRTEMAAPQGSDMTVEAVLPGGFNHDRKVYADCAKTFARAAGKSSCSATWIRA